MWYLAGLKPRFVRFRFKNRGFKPLQQEDIFLSLHLRVSLCSTLMCKLKKVIVCSRAIHCASLLSEPGFSGFSDYQDYSHHCFLSILTPTVTAHGVCGLPLTADYPSFYIALRFLVEDLHLLFTDAERDMVLNRWDRTVTRLLCHARLVFHLC